MPIIGNPASGGKKPTTPTIGTATDGGTGTTVSVAFTPSTYIGKESITYTALSNPGSISATGSGSPITVSGLTAGTAYTFTVKGDTNYGVASDTSSASNSVTPIVPTAFDSIATGTPNGVSTFTFSSIPSTYKSLQLRITSNMQASVYTVMRFNGDTAGNYIYHALRGDGATVTAVGGGGNTSIAQMMQGPASNPPYVNAAIIDIIDYASTSKNKTVRCFTGTNENNASTPFIQLNSGAWFSTAAINSITIVNTGGNNFTTGTQFALYGIKG